MTSTSVKSLYALIVDDEDLARQRLSRAMARLRPNWRVVEARDGVDALSRIAEQAPDVLFLDIQMPELNGFEVLQQLPSAPISVIFQTAYDSFALRAFDANACDYLLKPFDDARLEQAIQKAEARTGAVTTANLMTFLVKEQKYLKQFVVRVGARQKILDAEEVLYFRSEDHVTYICGEHFEHIIDLSLDELEASLDPQVYIRLHRHSIAALAAIDEIHMKTPVVVRLKNGVGLSVSRNRAKVLKDWLATRASPSK